MNLRDSIIVSVIIPTYKRAERLSRTIDSVLNQTFKNVEVIVVDDNSDGDEFRKATEIIMQKFSDNPKVVYLKHSINKNGSAARNTGIRYSKAKYVAFLDDDDYFLPTKIEKQVDLLERNLDCYGGVCCDHIALYEKYIYNKNKIKISGDGNYLDTLLNGENVLAAGSTLVVRRTVFEKIGCYDETFKRHQDWEFLVRFFREYKMLILSENLVCISADGIRNYPRADVFHSIKSNFLKKFEGDIMSLPIHKREEVYVNQWSEVILYYLIEYNFSKARIIYLQNLKQYKQKIGLLFIIKCIYMIVEKKLHFLQPLKYRFFSLRYSQVSD